MIKWHPGYYMPTGRSGEWQPFETAPKDGTFVVLEFESGHRCVAAWSPYPDPTYPFVWANDHGEAVFRPWKDDPEPIHWLPLPKPP